MIAVRPDRSAANRAIPFVGLAVASVAAFWFSLWSSATGGIDAPLGIAPAAVPLAAWAGYLSLRRQRAPEPAQELALDGPVGLVLVGAAMWFVVGEPSRLGWSYWAGRRDLMAFELFALGVACLTFGVATLWRAKVSLLVLVVGSPPVLIWLQEHLAPPLAAWTAGAAHLVAALLQLHFDPATAFNVFQGVSDAGAPYSIAIVDACSGLSSWISIILSGVPAALYLGLGLGGAAGWLIAGLVLSTLANIFRVVVLLFLAQHVSPDLALGTVHPILGTVLLFGVLLLLLLGIEAEPLPPHLDWRWIPDRKVLAAVGGMALIGAVGQFRLLPYRALPIGGPPGPHVSEPLAVLPQLPGVHIAVQHEITWQNLFGAASRSYLVHYQEPSGVNLVTQLVTTPDTGKLLTYTPDRCDLYHGENVRGQKSVDLGLGQVGFLVDSRSEVPNDPANSAAGNRELRSDLLYWYVPFTLNNQTWNARFVLILDSDDAERLPSLTVGEAGVAPGGANFDRVDAHLLTVGRQMIATLATTA